MEYFVNVYEADNEFILEQLVYEYKISGRYFFYRMTVGEKTFRWKRISEDRFVSAWEEHINA